MFRSYKYPLEAYIPISHLLWYLIMFWDIFISNYVFGLGSYLTLVMKQLQGALSTKITIKMGPGNVP